jgi:hypothetical protein
MLGGLSHASAATASETTGHRFSPVPHAAASSRTSARANASNAAIVIERGKSTVDDQVTQPTGQVDRGVVGGHLGSVGF